MPGISLFFPCYNDAGTIGGMVAAADAVAKTLTDDYEILVIDDGSTDSSRRVLEGLKAGCPPLRLIFHEKNQGYGAALRSGFRNAAKELVFYTDGDGQYDVTELKKLFTLLTPEVDVVNGYKTSRHDPLYRVIFGGCYQRLMRLLFLLPIRDLDCDFRLIRRTFLGAIELKVSSGAICLELVKKLEFAGARFAECPVHHYPRLNGRSQFFKPGRILRTILDVAALQRELGRRGCHAR